MKKQFKTWLPGFPGFYCTYFEPNLDNEYYEFENIIKSILERDNIRLMKLEVESVNNLIWDNFDNEEYENDIVDNCIDFVESNIPFISKIIKECIVSPKEYNFKNDSVNISIEIDTKEFSKWLYKNKEIVSDYLKEKYTGCSGFIPYYSNEFVEWEQETDKFTNFDNNEHYLGALLQCYLVSEFEDLEYMMYEFCEVFVGAYVNYDKIIEYIKEQVELDEPGYTFELKYVNPNQLSLCLI